MKSEKPLVSICIPTYNGARYLQEALDSVKVQTYKNIEVIISDDNSSDDTMDVCQKFQKEVGFPVSIFQHTPSGIGANWNHCIHKANGDYIKFLFQDDLLKPECVEDMLRYCIKNDLHAVVCKREIVFSQNFSGSKEWFCKYGDLQKGINLQFEAFYRFKKRDLYRLGNRNEMSYNFLGEPVAAFFKKELFGKVGQYSTRLKQVLDLDYYLKILLHYDIGIISKKLIYFRVHGGQTSAINAGSKVDEGMAIEQVLYKKFKKYLSKKQKKTIFYHKYPMMDRTVRWLYQYKILR